MNSSRLTSVEESPDIFLDLANADPTSCQYTLWVMQSIHLKLRDSAQVASLPEYLDWMEDFPEDAVHILAAINRGCPSLESSATLQA